MRERRPACKGLVAVLRRKSGGLIVSRSDPGCPRRPVHFVHSVHRSRAAACQPVTAPPFRVQSVQSVQTKDVHLLLEHIAKTQIELQFSLDEFALCLSFSFVNKIYMNN